MLGSGTDVLGHLGVLKLLDSGAALLSDWRVWQHILLPLTNLVCLRDTEGIGGISECFPQHQQHIVSLS